MILVYSLEVFLCGLNRFEITDRALLLKAEENGGNISVR
jgi:hypothetical protein